MRLSVVSSAILARTLLLSILVFSFLIRQFSTEQIEAFLHRVPYRCPLRFITGWRCAFCGMTHSWIAIFRGDFTASFNENIFGLPLLFAVIVLLLMYSFKKKITTNLKPALIGLSGILVFYAVFRNVA